jgi:uncharacterized protein
MREALATRRWGLWLALAAGLFGLWAGRTLNIPGGGFTGAMLATGAVNLWLGSLRDAPRWAQTAARAVLGISIGASVTGETVQAIANSLAPVGLMIVAVTFVGVVAAWAISRHTRMLLPTALCGAAPGALPAMVTLSEDLGGEAPVVATMHLIRLISILLIVPTLVTVSFAPQASVAVTTTVVTTPAVTTPVVTVAEAVAPLPQAAAVVLLLVAGLAAGFAARRANLPAGDLLAPMFVAALMNPTWLQVAAFPEALRLSSHWIIGVGVGVSINARVLRDFRPFALAGLLMTAFLIASGFALGWLLSVITEIDLLTAVIGCAPGGATPLIILSGELGADAQLVAAMHVTRMIILMVLLPVLIRGAARRLALRTVAEPPVA